MSNAVGYITPQIERILGLSSIQDRNIYIGSSNIQHMISSHPNDYQKYGNKISDILNCPDYIGMNPKDNSIEYVKEYKIDNEYVKVAVRISNSGKYYARSLYTLNTNRVNNFIAAGTLKKLSTALS